MYSVIVYFLHYIWVCDCDGRHESLIILSHSVMVRRSHLLARCYLGTMCMCTTAASSNQLYLTIASASTPTPPLSPQGLHPSLPLSLLLIQQSPPPSTLTPDFTRSTCSHLYKSSPSPLPSALAYLLCPRNTKQYSRASHSHPP
jgi:hypothetical protein